DHDLGALPGHLRQQRADEAAGRVVAVLGGVPVLVGVGHPLPRGVVGGARARVVAVVARRTVGVHDFDQAIGGVVDVARGAAAAIGLRRQVAVGVVAAQLPGAVRVGHPHDIAAIV